VTTTKRVRAARSADDDDGRVKWVTFGECRVPVNATSLSRVDGSVFSLHHATDACRPPRRVQREWFSAGASLGVAFLRLTVASPQPFWWRHDLGGCDADIATDMTTSWTVPANRACSARQG